MPLVKEDVISAKAVELVLIAMEVDILILQNVGHAMELENALIVAVMETG